MIFADEDIDRIITILNQVHDHASAGQGVA